LKFKVLKFAANLTRGEAERSETKLST
jgi:hypothetical protein